jgi:uncharacterized coiled-coil DUF342 family protein
MENTANELAEKASWVTPIALAKKIRSQRDYKEGMAGLAKLMEENNALRAANAELVNQLKEAKKTRSQLISEAQAAYFKHLAARKKMK